MARKENMEELNHISRRNGFNDNIDLKQFTQNDAVQAKSEKLASFKENQNDNIEHLKFYAQDLIRDPDDSKEDHGKREKLKPFVSLEASHSDDDGIMSDSDIIVVQTEPINMEEESLSFTDVNNFEFTEKDNQDSISQDHLRNKRGKPGRKKLFKDPIECTVCYKLFRYKSDLKRHNMTHTGETPFTCEVCYRGFNKRNNLKMHMRIHTGETPYICQVCDKRFNRSGALKVHFRIHTGETPYSCNVCNKSFKDIGHMKNHMRVHTGETYPCPVCGKHFTQRTNLNKHLRTHTDATPYKCKVCDKGFPGQVALNQHLRTHPGAAPYKCNVCNRDFYQRVSLKGHMKVHIMKGEGSDNIDSTTNAENTNHGDTIDGNVK